MLPQSGGVRTLLPKMFCTQLIVNPFIYLPLFYTWTGVVLGRSVPATLEKVQREYWVTLKATWLLFVPFNVVNCAREPSSRPRIGFGRDVPRACLCVFVLCCLCLYDHSPAALVTRAVCNVSIPDMCSRSQPRSGASSDVRPRGLLLRVQHDALGDRERGEQGRRVGARLGARATRRGREAAAQGDAHWRRLLVVELLHGSFLTILVTWNNHFGGHRSATYILRGVQ